MKNQHKGGIQMDFAYQADDSGTSETKNDIGTSHIATLIKAASPYFDPDTQRSLHFLSSIYDVMDSVQLLSQKKTVSAFSFSMKNVDFEGLLKGIRPVCSSEEKSLVDKFLNIFSMKRMFETYQMMSSMMSMFNQDTSSNDQTMNNAFNQSMNASPYPEESKYNNESTNFNNNLDYVDDFIYDNKPNPLNYEQMQDTLQAAQMRTSPSSNHNDTKQTNQDNDYNFENEFTYNHSPSQDHFHNTSHNTFENHQQEHQQPQKSAQQQFGSEQHAHPLQSENSQQEQAQEDKSNDNSQSMNTQQMMDMLGTMLTPEQKNTFESMKMLFNSGMFNS